jgi:hypothetical protein
LSEWIYSLLLRLYPRAFRERYDNEMRRLFRDRLAHEQAAGVWLDVLADAIVSIPLQHLRSRRPDPMWPSSAARLRSTLISAVSQMFIAGSLVGMSLAASFFNRLWPLTALLALAALATVRRAQRAGQAVRTYQAVADSDSVTVRCDALGIAPTTLRRSEVTGVHVFERAGLRIQAANPARDLWVPKGVPAYASVREHVTRWAPTTVTPLFRVAPWGDVATWQIAALTLIALVSSLSSAAGLTTGSVLATVAGGVLRRRMPARALLLLLPVGIVLARWIW